MHHGKYIAFITGINELTLYYSPAGTVAPIEVRLIRKMGQAYEILKLCQFLSLFKEDVIFKVFNVGRRVAAFAESYFTN